MDNAEEFPALIEAIEAAGYFTSFRPEVEGGQLACVSHRAADGRLHGNSFLVYRRQGKWFLTTWGDSIGYLVPPEHNVVDICVECLAASVTPIAHIPKKIVKKYGLRRRRS